MKRILLATLAVATSTVAGAPTGNAADLATRPYAKAQVDPAYDWSGFYLGGTAGGAWSRNTVGVSPVNGVAPLYDVPDLSTLGAVGSTTTKGSHAIVGGKVGYNVQAGSFVVGIEADLSSFRFNATAASTGSPFATMPAGFATFNETASASWLATIRGRVGYAADRVLVYGTGGAAFANVGFSNAYVGLSPHGFGLENEVSAASQTKTGWAAGAGIEYALTRNWIVSAEYLHVDLGAISTSGLVTTGGAPTATLNFSSKLTSDIVRGGISYKFGGPVLATY